MPRPTFTFSTADNEVILSITGEYLNTTDMGSGQVGISVPGHKWEITEEPNWVSIALTGGPYQKACVTGKGGKRIPALVKGIGGRSIHACIPGNLEPGVRNCPGYAFALSNQRDFDSSKRYEFTPKTVLSLGEYSWSYDLLYQPGDPYEFYQKGIAICSSNQCIYYAKLLEGSNVIVERNISDGTETTVTVETDMPGVSGIYYLTDRKVIIDMETSTDYSLQLIDFDTESASVIWTSWVGMVHVTDRANGDVLIYIYTDAYPSSRLYCMNYSQSGSWTLVDEDSTVDYYNVTNYNNIYLFFADTYHVEQPDYELCYVRIKRVDIETNTVSQVDVYLTAALFIHADLSVTYVDGLAIAYSEDTLYVHEAGFTDKISSHDVWAHLIALNVSTMAYSIPWNYQASGSILASPRAKLISSKGIAYRIPNTIDAGIQALPSMAVVSPWDMWSGALSGQTTDNGFARYYNSGYFYIGSASVPVMPTKYPSYAFIGVCDSHAVLGIYQDHQTSSSYIHEKKIALYLIT